MTETERRIRQKGGLTLYLSEPIEGAEVNEIGIFNIRETEEEKEFEFVGKVVSIIRRENCFVFSIKLIKKEECH